MTSLFVFICGKYDEKEDFENDKKDNNNVPLNKFYLRNHYSSEFERKNEMDLDEKLNDNDLEYLKRKRIFETKLRSVIIEVTLYCLFLFFLFVVAFLNTSSKSYWHNQIFHTTFVRRVSQEEIGLNDVRLLKELMNKK